MVLRTRALALAAALAAGASTGCGVAQGDETGTDGPMTYDETVMAPDACHVVTDEVRRDVTGDGRLIVTRFLVRQLGLCAAVVTPVAVSASIDDAESFDRITLRVVDEQARELLSVDLK